MLTEDQIKEATEAYVSKAYKNADNRKYFDLDQAGISFKAGVIFTQEKTAPKWVSISERLPETSGPVLGCMKETQDQYICWYKPSRKLFIVYGAGVDPISDMKVTHWMPLPTPPESNGK